MMTPAPSDWHCQCYTANTLPTGRKTAMSDADLGNWSYAYDKRSNLTRQTDARGRSTCMDYNAMGQLTTKSAYTGSACNGSLASRYAYTYDTNKARLTAVTQSVGGNWRRQLGYDSLGRPSTETITIDSIAKTATTYYDAYHRAYATKYPDGEIVKVNFNSLGLPKLMCSSYLHSSGSYWCTGDPWYVSDASYDEAGRLTAMKYPAGGNLWRTQTYHGWTTQRSGGLLNQIKVGTTNGGSNRLYRQYSYNSFGDVLNDGTGVSNFTYDSLDRLTSAYGQTFEYWATGRFKTFAGQSYGYDDPGPYHAVDRINNVDRYDYDANGNMTVRNKGLGTQQQTLEWNAENRLATVKNNTGGVIESYAYDADGSRIKEVAGSKTTRTFFPFYVEENGIPIKYYSFNGMTIAMRRGGTLTYLHSDHLSSSSLATDASGNAIPVNSEGVRYYAYGAVRSGDIANLQTDRTYTGQEQDGTGLMFYQARFYDPALGTFISPDTMVPNAGVVAYYNRFAYVRGNPLRYIDPTGHVDDSGNSGDAPCTTNWCWQNRWYMAHGLSWGNGNWGKKIQAYFADADILNDVLGEAGIAFGNDVGVGWNWSTQKDQMSAIGRGIVKFGNKLTNGMTQLKKLLGGGATLYHVASTARRCFGAPACALPPGTNSVYFGTESLGYGSYWIETTVVHELAHVIDWHRRPKYQSESTYFSGDWSGSPLTKYAACKGDCITSYERWAEAVTVWVFGDDYKKNERAGLTVDIVASQMTAIGNLLNEGRR